MKRAILLRHGQTVLNKLATDQPEEAVLNGALETELTPTGITQSLHAAIAIRAYKNSIVRAVSSALTRSINTRDLITRSLHITPITEELVELNERSLGDFEGQKLTDVLSDPWFGPHGLGKDFRSIFTTKAPNGENYTDVIARVAPAFYSQLAQIESQETLLLVAHGHVNRCLIGALLGLSKAEILRLPIKNCDPIILEEDHGIFTVDEASKSKLLPL